MRPHGPKLAAIIFALLTAPPARGGALPKATRGPQPGLVEQVKRAVVVVNSFDRSGRLITQGSGFFIGETQVVTNLHVVGRATRVEIKTYVGETLAAEGVVALEEAHDLALLEVCPARGGVTALPVSCADARAGEEVFVVSNPHGSPWAVSSGTARAARDFLELGRLVPITAPISRGSSGGPVVNLRGEVVGVAALAVRGAEEEYFALPAHAVARLRPRALVPFPLLPTD